MMNLTLLIVDDEPAICELLCDEFKELGFRTLMALSGRSAIDLWQKEGPIDLLLTDLKMPGVDGPQLIQNLRLRGFSGPVIAMSGFSETTPEELQHLGVVQFFPKPFDLNGLVAFVEQLATKSSA